MEEVWVWEEAMEVVVEVMGSQQEVEAMGSQQEVEAMEEEWCTEEV